jgi:hypothetical protein
VPEYTAVTDRLMGEVSKMGNVNQYQALAAIIQRKA